MLWRTHVLAGITSLWLLKPSGAMTSGNILLLVSLAAFGSLLPDLDARESKAKWLEIGGVAPLAPVAVVANGLWGHRGFLHSPVALILLALPLALVSRWWGWPFAVALWLGYGSHLLLDGCTRSGISAWPRTDARIHFLPARLRFVTGSMAEDAVFVVLAIAVLHLLFRYIA